MIRRFPESPDQLAPAGLVRRLTALLYDGLISVALLMVVTGIYLAVKVAVVGADAYQAAAASGAASHDPFLSSALFISLYLFFGYFWTRLGQTLGMQVWHLRVQTPEGHSISWLQALMRYVMGFISLACGGLGYFWCLWDKQGMTWVDRFSETRVVRIPKRYGKDAGKRPS